VQAVAEGLSAVPAVPGRTQADIDDRGNHGGREDQPKIARSRVRVPEVGLCSEVESEESSCAIVMGILCPCCLACNEDQPLLALLKGPAVLKS
jgi:hypothetical protein